MKIAFRSHVIDFVYTLLVLGLDLFTTVALKVVGVWRAIDFCVSDHALLDFGGQPLVQPEHAIVAVVTREPTRLWETVQPTEVHRQLSLALLFFGDDVAFMVRFIAYDHAHPVQLEYRVHLSLPPSWLSHRDVPHRDFLGTDRNGTPGEFRCRRRCGSHH